MCILCYLCEKHVLIVGIADLYIFVIEISFHRSSISFVSYPAHIEQSVFNNSRTCYDTFN